MQFELTLANITIPLFLTFLAARARHELYKEGFHV